MLYFLTQCSDTIIGLGEKVNGFVFYGGLLGATSGLLIYSKHKQINFIDLLDVYASLLPLGQAIGRIGCYLNGCCYGRPYIGILSVEYIIDGKEMTVFPTWFAESAFCLILFLMMFIINKPLPSGIYSVIYFTAYSVFRFLIEFFRGDSVRGLWYGLSTSQYLSILLLFSSFFLFRYSLTIKTYNIYITRRKPI